MLLQSEILDLFEKAKTRQEKIKVLKDNESPVLRALMRINFDPTVQMDLPEGEPPFNKEAGRPIGYQQTTLINEYRRFYIWLDPKQNLPKFRKERLFIEMLEGLHVSEAELLCLAKDKQLGKRFKTLKEDVVREAYPQTLPPKEVVKEKQESPLA